MWHSREWKMFKVQSSHRSHFVTWWSGASDDQATSQLLCYGAVYLVRVNKIGTAKLWSAQSQSSTGWESTLLPAQAHDTKQF